MNTDLETEQDDRVIPLQPIERKVSKKQQDHLKKARRARKVKKVSKIVEEKVVAEKVRPMIKSIVMDDPELKIDDIFIKVDKMLFTPASEPFNGDQGEYESGEVKPSQSLKSKVVEPVANPENLRHIAKEHETLLNVNQAVERFGTEPVAAQGIVFL